MSETGLHRTLLAMALVSLAAGLAAYALQQPTEAAWIWGAATGIVTAALAFSILRDFWIGRVGVDAIALLSMTGALALGEPLAGLVVAIMYSGGNVLEDYARGRAEHDLRALTDRTPRSARRKTGEVFLEVPVADVRVGDELQVLAGEVLPVDGVIVDESAVIDGSAVTGEPLPETHRCGAAVQSGTVNAGEAFRMRASAIADDSTYAGIVRLVAAAHTAKAPFLRLADRFALWLLPATILVAGAAWAASGDPIRALAVLVVATPCPLILAAPVAIIGGVSRAAKMGVLMKGGAALEALAEVRTAMFDKTGTLTDGGARLLATVTAPGLSSADALRYLASLEQASQHVLAASLVDLARTAGLTLSQPVEIREYRGSGMEGAVDGVRIRAGSRSLICNDKSLPAWAEDVIVQFRKQSVLTIFMTMDDVLAAVFVMGDGMRPDAPLAIGMLRAAGISRVVMVTGDDAETAEAIGALLKLDAIQANCTPAEKVDAVALEKSRAPTMMVGDGINDAPALAAANVGVAMGARGATASSEAADIVVLADRLELIGDALLVARRAHAIALQSIVAGLGLSGAAMIAAAFGLLPPIAGALLQEVIDVAVILNALRARSG